MALDAVCIRCLVKEINEKITGGRIDKIYQPEKDEIVLTVRTYEKIYRLVLCANSTYPRIHFTNTGKKNPATAPLFCMLLRKHLQSGKILSVKQAGLERIIEFEIESYDELGDLTVKKLIIEIMGRHSNIILTINDKIIDSIKRIDLTVSSVRQVLPGLRYEYPPKRSGVPLTEADKSLKIDMSKDGEFCFKSIMAAVSGISPLLAREIVYNCFGRTDIKNGQTENAETLLTGETVRLAEMVKNNKFQPVLLTDAFTGRLADFSAVSVNQYESAVTKEENVSMSDIIDRFYLKKDSAERMRQKSMDLVKLLNMYKERAAKKQGILRTTLKEAENKDKYKIYGELITANLYKIKEGDKTAEVENYYEEDQPNIKIPLDIALTPPQNAQRYFKRYQKARNAEIEAAKQLKENEEALNYLDSTLTAVLNAEAECDLNAIRTELAEQGYLKRVALKKTKKMQNTSKPLHFISSDGFDIYAGKNNTQNDYLTLKLANSNDLWFHTKNIHGSHVIIKLGLDKNVPEATIAEAAKIAAYYSQARESAQVPVDYTRIKNVKKPNGAKPGMVIYDGYNTLYVTPEAGKTTQGDK